MPLAQACALASSATTASLRPGQRQRRVRAAGERRRPVDVRQQLRLGRVADVHDGEAAIAPRAVAQIAGNDHVVQRGPLAFRQHRCFTGRAVHAGQRPARDDFRLGDVLQVDDGEDVIGVAVEMRGHVGVAPAGPPDAVDAQAGHFEKGDFPHLGGLGNIVDRQAGAEFLPVGDAVDEVVLEIAAHAVVGLHRHDVRAIGEQQHVLRRLQLVRARPGSGREKSDRLQVARIGGVENVRPSLNMWPT